MELDGNKEKTQIEGVTLRERPRRPLWETNGHTPALGEAAPLIG